MAIEQTVGLATGVVTAFEARFGDKDGALALLHAPAGMRDFFRKLADKADLPDSPPAGMQWQPFIRGWPEEEYYVITRTNPDAKAARPGMVATRMLAIPLSGIEQCGSLELLLALLADSEVEHAPERTFQLSTAAVENAVPPPLVVCVADQLLRDDNTVAVLGQDLFADTIKDLWRRLPPPLRRQFCFGFSFSPTDLKHTKANVVAVPAACEPRWRTYANCCSVATHVADSESALALLSGEHNEELSAFLRGLGLHFRSFSDFRRYSRLWKEWQSRQSQSADGVYALLRSLGSMVGDPDSGADQKREALTLATRWIADASTEGVLAQRSVKAAAFPDQAELLGNAISAWIVSRLTDGSTAATQELERVIAAVPTAQSAHWQAWVRGGLVRACRPLHHATAKTIWVLLSDEKAFAEVTGQLPVTAETESTMLATLPSAPPIVSERLEAWCVSRGWFVLAGQLILRRAGLDCAIAALIAHPKTSARETAISRACAGQPAASVWMVVGRYDSPALLDCAAQAALAEPALWTAENLPNDRWLAILDRAATVAPRLLLKTNAGAVTRRLFGALSNGASATPAIWQALQTADLLDLTGVADRAMLWSRLPEPWRRRARLRSARAWLERYYRDAPPENLELEPELVEAILDPDLLSFAFPPDSPRLGENGLRFLRAWGQECDCEHWLDALARNSQKSKPDYTGEAGELVLAKGWLDAMRRAKHYDEQEKHHYLWPIWRPLYNSLGFLERLSINYFQPAITKPQDTGMEVPIRRRVSAVFVTALAEEFAAVKAKMSDGHEHVEKGTIYEIGRLRLESGVECDVAVVQTGMGNAASAAATERALAFFQPLFAFFVGIAGGLRDDLAIGDVIVADKIYGYESGKAGADFKPRPEASIISHEAVQRANAIVRDRRWLDRISPCPKRSPTALVKPIAAGEKVLVSELAEDLIRLRKVYTDAYAVAMEEHGFSVALRTHPGVCFAVVRGISDLIENKAESDRAGSHEIAAQNAVAFACELLAGLVRGRRTQDVRS